MSYTVEIRKTLSCISESELIPNSEILEMLLIKNKSESQALSIRYV